MTEFKYCLSDESGVIIKSGRGNHELGSLSESQVDTDFNKENILEFKHQETPSGDLDILLNGNLRASLGSGVSKTFRHRGYTLQIVHESEPEPLPILKRYNFASITIQRTIRGQE